MISAQTTRSRRWRWLVGGVATLATVLAVASYATSPPENVSKTASDFMKIPCMPQEDEDKFSDAYMDRVLGIGFGCMMMLQALVPDMKTVRMS